jgi:hypothetical protein
MEQRFLSAKEAAEILRTTPGNLANMRMRGEGPSFIITPAIKHDH